MANVLVMYGSKINSKISCNFVNTQISCIKFSENKHYFTSFLKKKASTEKLLDTSLYEDVLDFHEYYSQNDWHKAIKQLDEYYETYKFDKIYIYGMPCCHDSKGPLHQIHQVNEGFKNEVNSLFTNMNIVVTQLKMYFLPWYFATKHEVEVVQFICDLLS